MPDPTPADEVPPFPRWVGVAITVGIVVVVGALVLAIAPLRQAAGDAIHGDTAALRADLRDDTLQGIGLLWGIELLHCLIPYPSEIINAAAGFAFGFWGAVPLVMAGWLASAVVCYGMGRYLGRPVLVGLLGTDRVTKAEAAVLRGGWAALIAARLLPIVPFSLTGYVAGAARVRLTTFMWTTVVGFLPLTALLCLFGSRLKSLSLSDPVLYAALVPVIVLVLGAQPLARRLSAREDAPEG